MRKTTLAGLLAAATAVAACRGEEPLRKQETNNPNVPVERLFDHDGCAIYRFRDDGRYIYFTRCNLSALRDTTTMWRENCGKNCNRHVAVMSAPQ